ncbi:MAG: helicase [Planctomycetes bacterium]|nr:helicase [Planctomycetota bacterium]
MNDDPAKNPAELFIVDNSDADWKVRQYLHDWCELSKSIDIATGYFEIGALLCLDPAWQKVDEFRILMGDEVSQRTHRAFAEGLARIQAQLDASIESEKEKNDFLTGVPAIVEALKPNGKIKCRVYRKNKFHAKAYITKARQEVIGSFALVGSSNFTYPGLNDNIELNVQLAGRQVRTLQDWYDTHWNDAEDVTPEILRVIERHIREYSPFEVYAKALAEFFRGHEMTADEWEKSESRIYKILDQYQKEGYHNVLKIGATYGGAFLCDGVGLGKTFIGMMLIERLIRDRKRVMLLAPKGAREAVWEPALRKYLPHLYGDFSNLVVFSHTDLQREGDFPERFERMKQMADAIIIDEAHHFRNPGTLGQPTYDFDATPEPGKIPGKGKVRPSRYRQLYDIIEGPGGIKNVFLLTATPINNALADFRHMVELFSRKVDTYFNRVGIHSMRGHFVKMERDLKRLTNEQSTDGDNTTNLVEAEKILTDDPLFHSLVVQRSRAYVRQSQLQRGAGVANFPIRENPKVASYSVKKTYGKLLDSIEAAFNKNKPLFVLALYYPLGYYKGKDASVDTFTENRQKQVVSLIRVQFLKRFESSARAFERSCERLLVRLLAFVTRHTETDHEKKRLERWMRKPHHSDILDFIKEHAHELWGGREDDEASEDLVSDELLENVEYLDRDEYDVETMLNDTYDDLDQVMAFIQEFSKFKPKDDDKLKALLKLLKTDPVLSKNKVLIFTEFADTARYLENELRAANLDETHGNIERVDSSSKKKRGDIIRAFAPYYNGATSAELGPTEIRILISTDVLSEGLNLQDATRLINYDIHWNPVRLMQRIGRVDRRLNPDVEKQLVADHPDQAPLRGKVAFWNFLPPDELDDLLRLYSKVSHKTLRISRTFGIEGKKLLRHDDDYEALKEFNEQYEGSTSPVEAMHLEYQALLQADPALEGRLKALPGRVFSGKKHPTDGASAVFFCYALPAKPLRESEPIAKSAAGASAGANGASPGEMSAWSVELGPVNWYLYDLANEKILEEPGEIVAFIRCTPTRRDIAR